MFLSVTSMTFAQSPWDKTDVDPFHNWTIVFNEEVDNNTINEENIFVIRDSNVVKGTKVYLNDDKKSATVVAPNEGYMWGERYSLYISNEVKSLDGKKLKDATSMQFTVKKNDEIVHILDPNLEKAIRNELDKSTGDITKVHMLTILSLDTKYINPKSFVGLEYATNLSTLNLEYSNNYIESNKISNIDFLNSFSNLQNINLKYNNIQDISVLNKLPNLKQVDLQYNPLTVDSIKVIEELRAKGVIVEYTPIETVNTAPILIQDIANQGIKLGESITLDLSNYFSDSDSNDSLTFTATAGSIRNNEWVYLGNELKNISVQITATDSKGASISSTFQLTVEPVQTQEDTLYNAIYNALINVESEIDVSTFTTNSEIAFETLNNILEDHPEIYYFQHKGSSFWSDGRFELKYKFPKSQIIEMNNQLEQVAQKIISENIYPGMTEFEKVKAIHDYVVLNTAYDYDNYLNGTVPDPSYNIYGLLLYGRAVCDGYAKTMVYLLEKIDIEVLYVDGYGDGELHAWNKVKIDGQWYSMDVTWDDPAPNREGYVRYNYFLIPDSKLDDDHSWDNTNLPQATDTKYLFMTDMWDYAINNGYYYYSSNSDDIKLYKIKIDGTDKTKISDMRANELVVYGNWIYFSNYSHGGYLFKIKTDGTELTKLNDFHVENLELYRR